jgi:hypothetical protein
MSKETFVAPGHIALAVGDVVLLDGGEHMVEMVNDCRARCVPMEKKNVKFTDSKTGDTVGFDRRGNTKSICPNLPRNLVLEHRGTAGLKEFQASKKAQAKEVAGRKGLVKLEPGDQLCYRGEICTVTEVAEKTATIGSPDGNDYQEKRWVNESFFRCCGGVNLNQPGHNREEALKQFLAQRPSPLPEAQTSDESTQEKVTEMKSRTKSVKSSRKTKPASKKSTATTKAAAVNQVRSKGKLGQLFGHSVVRVVVRAGAEGVEFDRVVAVLKAHKIDAKESTIKQNLRLGKTGALIGAELTKEQLAEFKA